MSTYVGRHRAASSTRGLRVGSIFQRARHRVGDGDAGFTLVEAIVSLVIFAMVAAAATLAIVTGIKSNNDTNDQVGAGQVAQQEIEKARAMPRTALPTATTPAASPVAVSSGAATRGNKTYSVRRTVSYAPAGASTCPSPTASPTDTVPHKVRVTVNVTIPGSSRSVRLEQVLAC